MCPCCDEVQEFSFDPKVDYFNTTFHANNIDEIRKSINAVYNIKCKKCGNVIQLNNAAQVEFNIHHDNRHVNYLKTDDKQALNSKIEN